jgi:hypothetical protein
LRSTENLTLPVSPTLFAPLPAFVLNVCHAHMVRNSSVARKDHRYESAQPTRPGMYKTFV